MASALMFSPDEQAFIDKILKTVDSGEEQIVEGNVAKKIFKASLPPETLAQIWHLADRGDKGFLTRMDLGVALRLISHAQFGTKVQTRFMNIPAPPPTLPYYELRKKRHSVHRLANNRPSTPVAGPSNVPEITREEWAESARLFIDYNPVNGRLKGSRVRELFLHSGLSADILSTIWDLVDLEYLGTLDLTQFILAMHFIREKTLRPALTLPASVLPKLYTEASTGRPMPRSTEKPWIISADDKRIADQQFDYWDPVDRGQLPKDLVLIVLIGYARQLNLTEPEALAVQIWTLLDAPRSDQLDRDGFAVAMRVLEDAAAGTPFPTVLPRSYVPPDWRREGNGGHKNPFTSLLERERRNLRLSKVDAETIRTRNQRIIEIDAAIQQFRTEQEFQERLREQMVREQREQREEKDRKRKEEKDARRQAREQAAQKEREEEKDARRQTREQAAQKEREEVERREREASRARAEREAARDRAERDRRHQEAERRHREARRRDSAPAEDETSRRARQEREEREAEAKQKAREERRAWANLEQNRWKDYYKILGVPKDADDAAIKKAHRRESLKHHPDKGGNEDTFRLVQEAREVLSNPVMRQRYDSLRT